jgi:acetamidase/formamidase
LITVSSGATLIFDTLSHEGLLEDQGRDPVRFFSRHGVPEKMILKDAIGIAASSIAHDFKKDGPHIITGPVAIEGAKPGDVLKVDIILVVPRVPSGVISNRHGKRALPDEFPETDKPAPDASAEQPEKYSNVSVLPQYKKMRKACGKVCCQRKPAGQCAFLPRLSWVSWALQCPPAS